MWRCRHEGTQVDRARGGRGARDRGSCWRPGTRRAPRRRRTCRPGAPCAPTRCDPATACGSTATYDPGRGPDRHLGRAAGRRRWAGPETEVFRLDRRASSPRATWAVGQTRHLPLPRLRDRARTSSSGLRPAPGTVAPMPLYVDASWDIGPSTAILGPGGKYCDDSRLGRQGPRRRQRQRPGASGTSTAFNEDYASVTNAWVGPVTDVDRPGEHQHAEAGRRALGLRATTSRRRRPPCRSSCLNPERLPEATRGEAGGMRP